MTPVGLNVPVQGGVQVDPAIFRQLKTWGYSFVRIDQQLQSPEVTAARSLDVITEGLQPFTIIDNPEQLVMLPPGALPEVGNEPDLEKFGWTLEGYINAANACIEEAIRQQRKIYVGAISNLDRDSLDFLAEMPWADWPLDYVACSFHRYPTGRLMRPTTPHKGFASRTEEVATLRTIVGGLRPLACTEVGYHDKEKDEALVTHHFQWERQFATDLGIEALIAYQSNDGPPEETDAEAHYGFRDIHGVWKPRAEAFAKE